MKSNIDEFNLVKSQVRKYLPQYLAQQGRECDGGKPFKCFSGTHTDNNPSCGVPKEVQEIFHCFSCGIVGDIFTAAHLLEQKPLIGPGFFHDNLCYLAQRFGVQVPTVTLDEDEQYELNTYRAYRNALQILLKSTPSKRVETKFKEYGWKEETRRALGVGCVTSHEDYITRMTKEHGYEKTFLTEVDLDRPSMFSKDCLLFAVRDEDGNPVGFAARNLKYEEEKAKYDTERTAIVVAKGEQAPEIDKLFKPSKYVNSAGSGGETGETKVRNRIYQKSKRLFGFDYARKFTPPLWVFEGYTDCVTAVDRGLKASSSIGSTSFSRQHLEMLSQCNIKHMIFVLDADKAGVDGTERFIKLLDETLAGRPGLKVEVVTMPEGSDDPDAFIRKEGLDEFKKLERMDVFSWSVLKSIKAGEAPEQVCDRGVNLILNEPNNLIRYSMSKKLALHTGNPESAVWREVMRRVDMDAARVEEDKTQLVQQAAKQLSSNPAAAVTILQATQSQLEALDKQARGYDQENVARHVRFLMEKSERNDLGHELLTGWPIFDEKLGGLPRGDCFVTIPGKTNQGKSSLLANIAWRVLDYNPESLVFYHTVDDSLEWFLPRLLGSKYGMPSPWFHRAGCKLYENPEFAACWEQAQKWLGSMIEDERLIMADASTLPATIPCFESWIKALRHQHPDQSLVIFGDNFHLYDLPGVDDGERKTRLMSSHVKSIANTYHATILMTMELPKESLRPGVRPRVANIKGTSGIAYDANINMGVYNDLKDFPQTSVMTWKDNKDMAEVLMPDGVHNQQPRSKPIMELVFDKVKVDSNFDGSIFHRFNPYSAQLTECTEAEQKEYAAKAYANSHPVPAYQNPY